MGINSLSTPFPYHMSPITRITPFTYRDGVTYLETLENIRAAIRDNIIPELDSNLAHLMEEFQKGITNSELTVSEQVKLWDTTFSDFMDNVKENIGEINKEVIEKHTEPILELIESASDPSAYLNRVKTFMVVDARPEGTLWPQSFSVNEDEGHVYIGYSGSLDGGITPVTRIAVHDLSGKFLHQKTFVTQASTSSEGLVWFRDGLRDLCFIVRPATAGRGYAIYNYDKGTLGPTIPLLGGNYKSAVAGDFFYTVNSNDSTNGFDEIYVYTFASIRKNAPVLVETIRLETRNTMEKVQSFTVNGGLFIFNHGKGKGSTLISVYSQTGKLVTAYTFDAAAFARAINVGTPGAIKDPTYYRHESEGAWVYKGKTLTGHVVDNNSNDYRFVILSHNAIDGEEVESLPAAMEYDTGWKELTLNAPFVPWNDSSKPMYRRIGNVVYVEGGIKGVPAGTFPELGHVIGNLAGLGPFRQIELPVQKTSGTGVATWKVRPGGDLALASTTATTPGPATWYPFTFSWMMA